MARQSMPCIPEVNVGSCCCCFSLRTGSLILGWLGLIGSVISIVSIVIAIIAISTGNTDSSINEDIQYGIPVLCIVLVILVCSAVIHYLLIRGVNKQKPTLMYPYIYLDYVGIILSILWAIITLIAIFTAPNVEGSVIFAIIIQTVIQIAVGIHFFMVVAAYCQQLLTDQDRPRHNMSV